MPAMISVTINIPEVNNLVRALSPEGVNDMLKEVAFAQQTKMAERVHNDGQDSFGGQIGLYSAAYMRVRTGIYNDYKVRKTGPQAGVVISAGRFTKGKNKGKLRPRYNRFPDRKVILSLTKQMELDLSIQPLPDGYGVGYNNPDNYQKSQWLQDSTYKKPIWLQTKQEEEKTRQVVIDYIENALR